LFEVNSSISLDSTGWITGRDSKGVDEETITVVGGEAASVWNVEELMNR
jgi:hypothetical protein